MQHEPGVHFPGYALHDVSANTSWNKQCLEKSKDRVHESLKYKLKLPPWKLDKSLQCGLLLRTVVQTSNQMQQIYLVGTIRTQALNAWTINRRNSTLSHFEHDLKYHRFNKLTRCITRRNTQQGQQQNRNQQAKLKKKTQCTTQNRNVHISVLNGVLWDKRNTHCGILSITDII